MRMRCRRGASTALSLAILVLVIVFGVVGLLASHVAVSSAQAEALRAAEMAAQAGREKLTAYLWKNVTSSGNITMLTLENRGDIGLTIDRAMAIGQTGSVLAERDLGGSPISLGAGERRTMRLDSILPGYTIYENVKKNVKNILFKTLRGNVFGSVYAAPERFEAQYGVTLTGGGTTITLTKNTGETFTLGEVTVTTISNVTVAQGFPYWDAEVYVIIALSDDDIYRGLGYWVYNNLIVFPLNEYSGPDWMKRPELVQAGKNKLYIPKHVTCKVIYDIDIDPGSAIYCVPYTGAWKYIDSIYPRPTWVLGEMLKEGSTETCTTYKCYRGWSYYWKERFYPQTYLPAGKVTIKAPQEITFEARYSSQYYVIHHFKLYYYVFYDAWNMSNIRLIGNKTQDTLYVDRPVKGGFVYVYAGTEARLPPPPQPIGKKEGVDIWLPPFCLSDDPELVVYRIKGDKETRSLTVDFGSCTTCDAYIAPGPGTYAPDDPRIQKCPKSGFVATCSNIPEGYTVILDGNPEH